MSLKKLKEELTKLIADTNDEALLSVVKEDIAFYQTSGTADFTDNLSPTQVKELEKLAAEPAGKDTVTLDAFKKATGKWRMNSFQKTICQ